jgi:hypothetical protein
MLGTRELSFGSGKANQCQNDARIIERREDGTSVGLCVLCAQEQWKLAAAEAMKA